MNNDSIELKSIIKEIIDYRGKTPKKLGSDWSNCGYRALSAKNIKTGKIVQEETIRYVDDELYKKWMKQEVERGTILITSEAPFGEVLYWDSDEKIVLSQRIFGLKIDDKYNAEYIYYYMTSREFKGELEARATGSTVTGLRQPELLKCKIKVPNKDIQDKIAFILKCIDRKIELNNQINDNLYEITNKLYEQLFVVERQDDWKEYNLQELMDISNGYSYTGKELVDTSVVGMATIKNFERTGGFKEEGFKDIEPIKAKDNHYADKFDILVACTDLTQNADIIGNAVMLLNTGKYEKVVISMDLVKILPKKNKYLVFSILNSKEFKNFALGYKTGTTVLHLNKNCFKDFNIKLPDLSKLDEFEKVVEVNYKKISSNLEENNTLTQLRDTLLPKLMNGEIDLDKVEI